MKLLSYNSESEVDSHECESYRDGDWIVFLCPKCEGYERRLNWRTGDMKVRDHSADHIQQSGQYLPDEIGHAFTCQN